MSGTEWLTISIIVPTYNEERDISHTLDALVHLDYPLKEIIVVDDSSDRTPEIVRSYAPHGVQLFSQSVKQGRTGARNLGILRAAGDIVVILNADVLLPKDFLLQIVPHYLAGADYVLVDSTVANPESAYARLINAEHRFFYGSTDEIEWTEGFSCRRAALLDVGLFPVGFPTPICAGEDGFVGEKLRAKTYRKVIDRSIVVQHVAPSSLAEYWLQQIGRGKGISQVKILLRGMPISRAGLRTAVKTVWVGLRTFLLFPLLFKAWRLAKHSPLGRRDFPPFLFILLIQTLAHIQGEWMALFEIVRASRTGARTSQHENS